MPIERIDIADDAYESEILEMLENSGFAPHREKDVIHLNGVGIGRGNSSVDIEIDLVAMDGHRILEITAPLRMPPVTFELASLMCTQGNTHTVHAIMTLYADHLSETELSRMLYLFIKEIDRVDDELLSMIKTH